MLTGLFGTGIVDTELGLTGGVGAAVGARGYVLRAIFDVHVVQPGDSGYEWDIGTGVPECRDEQTGAVVHESLCSIDHVLTGISADGSLILPAFGGGIHLGAGYRLGAGSTAYALLGYGFNPERRQWNLLFRLIAGRDLLGLQAVATLPLDHR